MKLTYAHICINTEDLDKTEEFYTQVLGLEKVYNFTKNKKVFGFYLRISGMQFIEVFKANNISNTPASIRHLCLETDNIDGMKERLNNHDIDTTEKKLGSDNSYQIWFKDPNGIDIELHEYTDKSSQITGEDVEVDW
jgi:glyoxylase I family protein